jgi:hypothetical protein
MFFGKATFANLQLYLLPDAGCMLLVWLDLKYPPVEGFYLCAGLIMSRILPK